MRIRDEESEIAGVVGDCLDGLRRVLERTIDPSARESILRDLFDVFAWDRIEQGGFGMGEPAAELLVHRTTAAERRRVVGWLIGARPSGDTKRATWGRRAAGELCLELLGGDGDPAEVEDILGWSGLARRHIERLVRAGRTDEALGVLATASDDLCVGADLGQGSAWRPKRSDAGRSWPRASYRSWTTDASRSSRSGLARSPPWAASTKP